MYLSEISIPRDIGKIEYGPRIRLTHNQLVVGGSGRGGQVRASVHLSRGAQSTIVQEPFVETLDNGATRHGVRQFLAGAIDVVFTDEGKPLIVEPSVRSFLDNRVLVVCHLDSGLGSQNNAWFNRALEDPHVLARGHRWCKPDSPQYASSGKVAEIVVILKEGESLSWSRRGKRGIKVFEGEIIYNGRNSSGQPTFSFNPTQQVRKVG
ncbi:MAG TPA: hypothetical protein PK295_02520 [Candidatus Magasanikbacteria bacterium]|nr:hypothetical protein [Candidatus Magasanikbacteria bacterium]